MNKICPKNIFMLEFVLQEVVFEHQIQTEFQKIYGEVCINIKFFDQELCICEGDMVQRSHNQSPCKRNLVQNGRSCIVALNVANTEKSMEECKVDVEVYKKSRPGYMPEKTIIGSTSFNIEKLIKYICCYADDDGPKSQSMNDIFEFHRKRQTPKVVKKSSTASSIGSAATTGTRKSKSSKKSQTDPAEDESDELCGTISLFVRASYFGGIVNTAFQMNLKNSEIRYKNDVAQFLFKTNENVSPCIPAQYNVSSLAPPPPKDTSNQIFSPCCTDYYFSPCPTCYYNPIYVGNCNPRVCTKGCTQKCYEGYMDYKDSQKRSLW